MKSEETVYDKTKYDKVKNDPKEPRNNPNTPTVEETNKENKNASLKGKAASIGTGILMGGLGAFAAMEAEAMDFNSSEITEGQNNVTWNDGEVDIAENIKDDMSFKEAFEAARKEVGPGGAFEWRGNVYNTFTAEEWNGMSKEEREEYASHFKLESPEDDNTKTTENMMAENDPEDEETMTVEVDEDENTEATENMMAENDPEDEETMTVEVDEDENTEATENMMAENDPEDDPEDEETMTAEVDDVESEDIDPDIEILGIEHDDDNNSNYAEIMIDGENAVLVDVDGMDDTFEYLAADLNGDGEITPDEIADISDEDISVSSFEDDIIGDDSLYADNDIENDYTNDADIDDYNMA